MTSKTLLNATDMSKTLGITRESFIKGVKSGRFTKAKIGKFGHPLFDPSVVRKEYADTRVAAELQDHARMLPPGMRGGRPKKAAKKALDGKAAAEKPSDTISQQQILKVKLEKEKAQTKTLDLKYKIQKGEYIKKEEAVRQGVELGELVIGAMQAWASRLAPELAATMNADQHDIGQILEREVNNLIHNIRRKCGYET